ncbi:hypothetical protein [Aeromonas sp. 604176]|uniref:hypothetical protein n=1 Tax=Aeromonas sp. 604176 TaxID=2712052 RepID=UPI003BA33478
MTECDYVDGKPFYDKDWCAYDEIYINFTIQYTQLMLGYVINKGVFSSFPYNLPPYHLFPTLGLKAKVLRDEMIRRGLDTTTIDAEFTNDILESLNNYTIENMTNEQQLVSALFNSFMSMSRYGLKMGEHTFPDFENIHIAQNLISICSISEGFIVSSLSYLMLKSKIPLNNQHPKEKIKTNDHETIDKMVFNLTKGSFVKNLEAIEHALDIVIGLEQKFKNKLQDLFLIRNLYVHNNGIVNGHFRKMTNNYKEAVQGAKLLLNENEVEDMLDTLTDTVYRFYKITSLTCLNKQEKQLVKGATPMVYA